MCSSDLDVLPAVGQRRRDVGIAFGVANVGTGLEQIGASTAEAAHAEARTAACDGKAGDRIRREQIIRADGGAAANRWMMQFQADILGVPVVRPKVIETTALGAAYAAGLAVGFWASQDELVANWEEDKRWEPTTDEEEVERALRLWKKAVERSRDWVDEDVVAAQG